MIQRIVEDGKGRVWPVIRLYDKDDNTVNEVWQAVGMAIDWGAKGVWVGSIDQVVIYTVH